jgi:protein DJ-1
MPKALILVADGSEEIEFVTPYDGMYLTQVSVLVTLETILILRSANTCKVLTRAGYEVTSAGVNLQHEGYAQYVTLYHFAE